jgi:hypothetical protein
MAVGSAHATVNLLVVNPSFDEGGFAGWTLANGGIVIGGPDFSTGSGFISPESGPFFAALSTFGEDGSLTQTLTDHAGCCYHLTYWLNADGSTGSNFSVQWDGVTVPGSELTDPNTNGWKEYGFQVAGTGSDTLTFVEENDNSYFGLDNVSVVPEPRAWALMILGVGVIGAALRRRRPAVA